MDYAIWRFIDFNIMAQSISNELYGICHYSFSNNNKHKILSRVNMPGVKGVINAIKKLHTKHRKPTPALTRLLVLRMVNSISPISYDDLLDRTIIAVAYQCGLRVSEYAASKSDSINRVLKKSNISISP